MSDGADEGMLLHRMACAIAEQRRTEQREQGFPDLPGDGIPWLNLDMRAAKAALAAYREATEVKA